MEAFDLEKKNLKQQYKAGNITLKAAERGDKLLDQYLSAETEDDKKNAYSALVEYQRITGALKTNLTKLKAATTKNEMGEEVGGGEYLVDEDTGGIYDPGNVLSNTQESNDPVNIRKLLEEAKSKQRQYLLFLKERLVRILQQKLRNRMLSCFWLFFLR